MASVVSARAPVIATEAPRHASAPPLSASASAAAHRLAGIPESRQAIAQWCHEVYFDQLRKAPAEGSKAYRAFLGQASSPEVVPLSGFRRVGGFNNIKYGYPMPAAGYTVAAHVVEIVISNQVYDVKTYYCYSFWRPEAATPEYVALGATYDSLDGEFRSTLLLYSVFVETYEQLLTEADPLEKSILKLGRRASLQFETHAFPESEAARISACIDACRLDIRTLVACCLRDGATFRHGGFQAHMNRGYIEAVLELIRVASERVNGYAESLLRSAVSSKSYVFATGGAMLTARCGLKLIPLSARAAISPGDVNYYVWRELYVSRMATDLVVNGISPSFPIANSWTLIDGARPVLFENEPMRRDYAKSAAAKKAVAPLREAREDIRDDEFADDPAVRRLDARVADAIEYARSFLLMSKTAIALTTEYVGYTLGSLPKILRKSHVMADTRLAFSDATRAARYLFDLLYAAHALHSRLSVVHGDLHLNNVTYHVLQYNQMPRGPPRERIPITPDEVGDPDWAPRIAGATIAYVAGPGGAEDTYVFPHDGAYASIIDFSRALLGPGARDRLIKDQGEAFAETFYRDQVNRVMRALDKHLPEFVRDHQEELKGLILSNFEAVFPILAAVDYLAITKNFAALLTREAENDKLAASAKGAASERTSDGAGGSAITDLASAIVTSVPDAVPEPDDDLAPAIVPPTWAPLVFTGGAPWGRRRRGEALPWYFATPDYWLVNVPDAAVAFARDAEKAVMDYILVGLHDLLAVRGKPVASPLPGAALLPRIFRDYKYGAQDLRDKTLTDLYNIGAPYSYSVADFSSYPPWGDYNKTIAHLGGLKVSDFYDRGVEPFVGAMAHDSSYHVLMRRLRAEDGAADSSSAPATSSWIRE